MCIYSAALLRCCTAHLCYFLPPIVSTMSYGCFILYFFFFLVFPHLTYHPITTSCIPATTSTHLTSLHLTYSPHMPSPHLTLPHFIISSPRHLFFFCFIKTKYFQCFHQLFLLLTPTSFIYFDSMFHACDWSFNYEISFHQPEARTLASTDNLFNISKYYNLNNLLCSHERFLLVTPTWFIYFDSVFHACDRSLQLIGKLCRGQVQCRTLWDLTITIYWNNYFQCFHELFLILILTSFIYTCDWPLYCELSFTQHWLSLGRL